MKAAGCLSLFAKSDLPIQGASTITKLAVCGIFSASIFESTLAAADG